MSVKDETSGKGFSAVPRRTFIKGVMGLAAASMVNWPLAARADGGRIVVSNWGGDWNDRTVRFVEKPLEERGFQIVRDLGMETERKAKLLAERRIRRSSVDVIHLNSADAFELQRQQAVIDLDLSRIPNYADVVPALKTPYFIPWLYSGVVIITHKDKVPAAPTAYADLWDPKWKGRVGLTNQLYFNYMMIAGLIKTGNMTSVDAGRDLMAEFREKIQPRIYATHQQMAAGLANGEVDVAVNYKARGVQWIKDGLPLAIQYPKEGAVAVTFGACVPQNAPDLDGAYAYADAMLAPEAMAGLAGASYYAPANGKAALDAELSALVDFSDDEKQRLRFLDYGYVADNTAEWLDWWNKNVARG